jgi:hypothetical protein
MEAYHFGAEFLMAMGVILTVVGFWKMSGRLRHRSGNINKLEHGKKGISFVTGGMFLLIVGYAVFAALA